MIVAGAGRRIDAPDGGQPRFPLENVAKVRRRIRALLEQQRVAGVVSSAACGADLVVLSEAVSLGLRCRVVLPIERARFRESSVVDRPGDWGPLFDRVLDGIDAVDL